MTVSPGGIPRPVENPWNTLESLVICHSNLSLDESLSFEMLLKVKMNSDCLALLTFIFFWSVNFKEMGIILDRSEFEFCLWDLGGLRDLASGLTAVCPHLCINVDVLYG